MTSGLGAFVRGVARCNPRNNSSKHGRLRLLECRVTPTPVPAWIEAEAMQDGCTDQMGFSIDGIGELTTNIG